MNEETFTWGEVEAACCIWEYILSVAAVPKSTNAKLIVPMLTEWGRGNVRYAVIDSLTKPCQEAYEWAVENLRYAECFDWEFVPTWVAECCDWAAYDGIECKVPIRENWKEILKLKLKEQ